MFGISFDTWKEICSMYFSLHAGVHKAYLQWFPFSKLSDEDKTEIAGEGFYNKYIKTGGGGADRNLDTLTSKNDYAKRSFIF